MHGTWAGKGSNSVWDLPHMGLTPGALREGSDHNSWRGPRHSAPLHTLGKQLGMVWGRKPTPNVYWDLHSK